MHPASIPETSRVASETRRTFSLRSLGLKPRSLAASDHKKGYNEGILEGTLHPIPQNPKGPFPNKGPSFSP